MLSILLMRLIVCAGAQRHASGRGKRCAVRLCASRNACLWMPFGCYVSQPHCTFSNPLRFCARGSLPAVAHRVTAALRCAGAQDKLQEYERQIAELKSKLEVVNREKGVVETQLQRTKSDDRYRQADKVSLSRRTAALLEAEAA